MEVTERHLSIPRAIAGQYARKIKINQDEFEELVSEGNLALVVALRCYDPGRGASLATHIYWRVRGAISHRLRKKPRETEQLNTYVEVRMKDLYGSREEIRHALKSTNPLDRVLFILHYGYDISFRELGRKLGSNNTNDVIRRIKRLRKQLAEPDRHLTDAKETDHQRAEWLIDHYQLSDW